MILATSYEGVPTLFGVLCGIAVLPAVVGLMISGIGRRQADVALGLSKATVVAGAVLWFPSFPPTRWTVPIFYIGPIAVMLIGGVTWAISRLRFR